MLEEVSGAARIAEVGEAITAEELALAARNHGMPLEAMRYDVTPAGLHYLLTHYDIPVVDPSTWRLRVAGEVREPLELDLAALRALPAETIRVTMECAGNGRAQPRAAADQSALAIEAVGTADGPASRSTGAGGGRSRSEGGRRGLHGGGPRDRARRGAGLSTQPAARGCVGAERPARVRDERGGPAAPARLPAALIVPGWYGMAR